MAESTSFSHLVVVGASAGGIEALSKLVATLPEEFSAPIVIAQHLDPDRISHLQEILSRRSTLPVRTVTEHEPLEAGVVFVVPANRNVNITDSEIDLRSNSTRRPMPSIDLLFSSAAEAYGECLIAVILTGTGSDGAEGARIVRRAGGTVIIQDPETAEFADMPRSLALNTVDIVANLERIGPILQELLADAEVLEERTTVDERRTLEEFLEGLRESYGLDFRSYKTSTIMRRLKRRMVATDSETIEAYSTYLSEHPEEYRHLINAFLIKVTEFFRDPELFAYLKEEVLPQLIEEAREKDQQLRIWSAGCATGEEAYSLAILLSEILGGETGLFNVRVFATDVDEEAVTFARRGIYPASALPNLTEEQIGRYFLVEDGQYRVKKQVRSMIVFGDHDLARRSPFPRMDLVMSRNVLIYFTTELQRRALQLFAYSLRDDGYLVLGKAETISPLREYFVPQHREHKVYRRQGERFLMPPTSPVSPTPRQRPRRSRTTLEPEIFSQPQREMGLARFTDENLLNRLPVGVVVVDRHYDIQTINTTARRMLSIRGAAVGEDVLHAMREVPYEEIRRAIDDAFRGGSDSTSTEVLVVEEIDTGESRYLQFLCYPERNEDAVGPAETVMIVVNDITDFARVRHELEEQLEGTNAEFERFRREAEAETARLKLQNERLIETNHRLDEANTELTDLNEELQTAYEESLLSTEEAQAATEEVETLNEELQASNEELETLNEELQATIEELNTTNDDLHARGMELQEVAESSEEEQSRLEAILESVPDTVLVVDAEGGTVRTNEAYRRMFGAKDLIALDDASNVLPPDDSPQGRALRGESFDMEFTAIAADGTHRRFEAIGRPVRGGQDDGRGGVIIIREAGEYQRQE